MDDLDINAEGKPLVVDGEVKITTIGQFFKIRFKDGFAVVKRSVALLVIDKIDKKELGARLKDKIRTAVLD